MYTDKAKFVSCPLCGRDWPFPLVKAPAAESSIDWTCSVCLHGHISSLKRQLIDLYDQLSPKEPAAHGTTAPAAV